MLENDIFKLCVKGLQRLPPIKDIKKHGKSAENNTIIDLFLDIVTDKDSIRFAVEVKGMLKRPLPQHFKVIKKKLNVPYLIMTDYINPSIAEDLKRNDIYYIDSIGNMYIYVDKYLYVHVQGKKKEIHKEKLKTTLFQPTGLQLLFLLLAYPELLSMSIRSLKNLISISYGQTQASLKELKDKEHVYKGKQGKLIFRDRSELLKNWLGHYGDRLRPKLVLGSYKMAPSIEEVITERLSNILMNEDSAFAIGGGLGADILLHYYRGQTTEVFIRPDLLERTKEGLKLIPAKETNVTILNMFSKQIIFQEKTLSPVAHPLFLYAELLFQGNSRALETAEIIYNTYLKKDFDET